MKGNRARIQVAGVAALSYDDLDALPHISAELDDLGCEPLPDAEQERLWVLWREQNDEDARVALWASWRRYALAVAKKMARYSALEDTYQVVQAAIWEAMTTWDPHGGSALGPWSQLLIMRRLREHARDWALVALPEKQAFRHKVVSVEIDERDSVHTPDGAGEYMTAAVRSAVMRLPRRQQIAVRRWWGIDSSVEPVIAIAAELDIAIRDVKPLLRDAIHMLAHDPEVQRCADDCGLDSNPLSSYLHGEQLPLLEDVA